MRGEFLLFLKDDNLESQVLLDNCQGSGQPDNAPADDSKVELV